MSTLAIRDADPGRDAAACAAIYAPYVEVDPDLLRGAPAGRGRDGDAGSRHYAATHPWLVAEDEGEVVGYAYACRYQERPAYRWAAEVSVYVAAERRGEGLGRGLYEALFERLRAPALPGRLRRHHPAQRGQRRPARAPRLRPHRRQPPPRLEGGRWHDVSWWQLELAPAGRRATARAAAAGVAAPTRLPLANARRASSRPPASRLRGPAKSCTEEDVYEALEEVIDPELGLDFVSLGLVYDVDIENEDVYVTFTLTTPACPIGPQVSEQMKEFVGDLPGVTAVHPKMVFDPAWSPEMMTDDAKFALGF